MYPFINDKNFIFWLVSLFSVSPVLGKHDSELRCSALAYSCLSKTVVSSQLATKDNSVASCAIIKFFPKKKTSQTDPNSLEESK